MKEKIKTTSFWLGVSSAVVIILESVSSLFNINIASELVEDIIMSICSILVLLGIINKKNSTDTDTSSKEELLMEFKEIDIDTDDKTE